MRKSVDMPAGGYEVPGSAWDYRANGNDTYIAASGTTWVRFWARWNLLQPDPRFLPSDPQSPNYSKYFLPFDAQVQKARADGKNVIIVAHQFPRWANATSHLTYGSPEEIEFGHRDRMTYSQYAAWEANGRRPDPENRYRRKDLEFRVPLDIGPETDWGRWIRWLIDRYRDFPDGRVAAIEICNEPNIQYWPLMGPGHENLWANGDIDVDCTVVTMMNAAKAISESMGHPGFLMAPAVSDIVEHNRLRTSYLDTTEAILNLAPNLGFQAHGKFCWSVHNYEDMVWDIADNPANSQKGASPNRTAEVRRRLRGRWSGWPQGGVSTSNPHVFVTEGGVDIRRIMGDIWRITGSGALTKQAELIQRTWNRHYRDTGEGQGVAMLSNYQMYTSGYDTGLRDSLTGPTSGAARPAYSTWKSFPAHR